MHGVERVNKDLISETSLQIIYNDDKSKSVFLQANEDQQMSVT